MIETIFALTLILFLKLVAWPLVASFLNKKQITIRVDSFGLFVVKWFYPIHTTTNSGKQIFKIQWRKYKVENYR